jgi:HK97 gp10 family phage protein
MEIEVKVEGFEELTERLETINDELKSELNEAIEEVSESIRDDAKQAAPVDTGTLMRSIKSVLESMGTYIAKGIVGTNVEYAPYQEFGTQKMQAQPYLRPALDRNRSYIIQRLEEAVQNVVGG